MAGTAQFKLEIKGMEGLVRALKQYPAISRPVLQRAFVGIQAVLAKHTLKGDPVPWRTGFLLMSFRFKIGELSARWFPTAAYAPFVEFGTRPHVITAKSKRALFWLGASHPVRSVKHPGSKANPFMEAIVEKSTQDALKLFGQAQDVINREIAKQTSFN